MPWASVFLNPCRFNTTDLTTAQDAQLRERVYKLIDTLRLSPQPKVGVNRWSAEMPRLALSRQWRKKQPKAQILNAQGQRTKHKSVRTPTVNPLLKPVVVFNLRIDQYKISVAIQHTASWRYCVLSKNTCAAFCSSLWRQKDFFRLQAYIVKGPILTRSIYRLAL